MVYYEGFFDETVVTLLFNVKALTDDCVTGKSFFATPIEYTFIVREDNAPLNLSRADNNCGPWNLSVDLGNLINKATVNANSELVLSENISVVDAGEYLLDVTYTFFGATDNGFVKVIILEPFCSLTSIAPKALLSPQFLAVFEPTLTFTFEDFEQVEACPDNPALTYSYEVFKGGKIVSTSSFLTFRESSRSFSV